MKKAVYITILISLILGSATAAEGGETPVDQILSITGARLQWDPIREVGALWKGNTRISFRAGAQTAVVNGTDRISLTVSRSSDGVLSIDNDGAGRAVSLLLPDAGEERRRVAAIFIDP
jgi:hypothetical protein